MTTTTAPTETYYDGQIVVENGLTIKVEVQHTVKADRDTITISRIIRKYKQSGTGWRYAPFSEEVESTITLNRMQAPDLARDLMWAMAIGAEQTAEERLTRS